MAFGSWFYKVRITFQSTLMHREQKIIVPNWVWLERYLPPTTSFGQICLWLLKLMTSQMVQGMRNCISGNERFRCEWVNIVIFNWVLKVIRDCIGFALLCSVIGLENSRHLLSQSDTKLKPITTWLHAFTSISHWLPLIFSFVLIGCCDYFGFGFTTLNRKAL